MSEFNFHPDLPNSWCEHGFAVLDDFIPLADLELLRLQIFQLFLSRFNIVADDPDSGLDLILTTYGEQRELWRQCASRLGYLPALAQMAGNCRLTALARRLGLLSPIFATQPEIRIDIPRDEQYPQPWHQDWRSGQTSLNSITLWIPLQNTEMAMGPLQVAPRSHKHGLLNSEELKNPRRFLIKDPRFSPQEVRHLDMNLGDCVVFSQFTAHRSGINNSSTPRISVQIRFADLFDQHFQNVGYASPSGSGLISEKIPSEKEMKEIFRFSK